jgi:hypothetical protein
MAVAKYGLDSLALAEGGLSRTPSTAVTELSIEGAA